MNRRIFLSVIVIITILLIPVVIADDDYKPYLHEPKISEGPKIKLYGSYSTNLFPGAAIYSYPIDIPNGRNSLTPVLSINYNSQSIKGFPSVLGSGWQITTNYVYRDVNSTPADISDDFFKLIFKNSEYELVYDGSEYRTKYDAFIRIQNFSNHWLVIEKDGTKYRFEFNLTSDYGYNSRWYLNNVTDVYGNEVYYSYLVDTSLQDKRAVYPSNITYNNDRLRSIKFEYENNLRPDRRRIYDEGLLLEESRRLTNITIYAKNNLVRRYDLEYTMISPGMSALSKISYIGDDGNSHLHNITFKYYNMTNEYINSTYLWAPPVYMTEDVDKDYGVRLLDVNNDGYMDIMQARKTVLVNKTWINNKEDGWNLDNSLASPVFFVDHLERDEGVRFLDVNSDGFIDMLQAKPGVKNSFINNGSSWLSDSKWDSPVDFVEGLQKIDNGVRTADINADGKLDIVRALDGDDIKAWINNGSGWTDVSSVWISPVNFFESSKDTGARLLDVNGDGYADIVQSNTTGNATWFNNGNGWISTTEFLSPVAFVTSSGSDAGIRFMDFNADGLTDIVQDYKNGTQTSSNTYINNGTGWVLDNYWISPETFTKDGKNTGRRIADVNGDGFADIIVGYSVSGTFNYTWIRNSTRPGMLKSITNEYGGVTEISYSKSTDLNNTGNDSLSDIGFNVWVVSSYTSNNSLNDSFFSFGNTSYNYSDGFYDYRLGEFRGFARVFEFLPSNFTVKHDFYQDDILKGKESKTTTYDSSGSVFSIIDKVFNYSVGSSFKIFLESSVNYFYDGDLVPKVTFMNYSYDDYGNLLSRVSNGDSGFDDDKYEYFEYVYNTDSYIVDKLKKYSMYDWLNTTLLSEVRNSYDGLSYGSSPTKGSLTRTEKYLDTGSNVVNRFSYDSYGNVISKVDSLGRETRYEYGLFDVSHTYANKVINALDQSTYFHYDLGTGNLIYSEKNGIKNQFFYDAFGRISKEVRAGDTVYSPSKTYTYLFDGVAPEVIVVSDKTHGNESLDNMYLYDGFGNLVQVKTKVDSGAIVKSLLYDSSFRVDEELNPFFGSFDTNLDYTYSNSTRYIYDSAGRVVIIYNPDDTNKSILFDKSVVTAFDENKHRKDYHLDGFDRIVSVIEYNNEPHLFSDAEVKYVTNYSYDTQDNLILIIDNEGNRFEFEYDSLGRKISMNDPDMGSWSYSYDSEGNLISQTSGGGQLVTGDGFYREYDDYGQLSRVRAGNNASGYILEEYLYDYEGIRMASTLFFSNGSVKEKTITPSREFTRIINGSGSYDYEYIYQGDKLVARKNPDGSKYFYHDDHLGSVSLITDESGNVVEKTFYEPFGAVMSGSNVEEKIGYTGHEYDEDTGQVYMGARYYDPEQGQTTSGDSIISNFYKPQNLNRYAYSLNNPYRYLDPDGNVIVGFEGLSASSDKQSGIDEFTADIAQQDKDVAVKVFAQAEGNEAYDFVMNEIRINPNQPIQIIGHSAGAKAAIDLSKRLDKRGLEVDRLVTLDNPSLHALSSNSIPSNVVSHSNYYQSISMPVGIGYPLPSTSIKLNLGHTILDNKGNNPYLSLEAKDFVSLEKNYQGTKIPTQSVFTRAKNAITSFFKRLFR